MFDIIQEILTTKKEFTETDCERLKKSTDLFEKNSIGSEGNIYLTFDSLI